MFYRDIIIYYTKDRSLFKYIGKYQELFLVYTRMVYLSISTENDDCIFYKYLKNWFSKYS